MPTNNNSFNQTYPQAPQMQQPYPPMSNNMSPMQQSFPSSESSPMLNQNFQNIPYPQQIPQGNKSNKGCFFAGIVVGCVSVILLCIGIVVFIFFSTWAMLPNAIKPIIVSFALFNDVCGVKIDEKTRKEFVDVFAKHRIEEKYVILSMKPREFYDTAFSDQLKSEYSYEQFTKDIQPLNTTKFCEEYKTKISSENIPIDGNSGGQIAWGPFGGYVVRITINPSDGLITDFKVEKSDQQNYDDFNDDPNTNTNNNDSRGSMRKQDNLRYKCITICD